MVFDYENIEKSWKKYRFHFVGLIIAVFITTISYTSITNSIKEGASNDNRVVFELLAKPAEDSKKHLENLIAGLAQVHGQNATDILTLEIAKEYLKTENNAAFEEVILTVMNSDIKTVKNIANYMYAEFLLENEQAKAQDVFKYLEISKNDFVYPLIQEVQAMALAQAGKKDEADVVYHELLQNVALSAEFKQRITIKLEK